MLNFTGNHASMCLWASNSVVIVSSETINVWDIIEVFPDTIRDMRSKYFVQRDSVRISPPINPIVPKVSLSGPMTIGSCSDLYLDPTLSSGNAGRDWKLVEWMVTAASTNHFPLIEFFLNSKYNFTSKIVIIPKIFLQPGEKYNIHLSLRNFLGIESMSSVSVSVSFDFAMPLISISGKLHCIILRFL
jgi:hypothetical protein